MAGGHDGKLRDLGLRAGGASLLWLCYALARLLEHAAQVEGGRPTTAFDFAVAAACFLSFSAGAVLATLGARIFDRIRISDRWTHAARAHALHRDPIEPRGGGRG